MSQRLQLADVDMQILKLLAIKVNGILRPAHLTPDEQRHHRRQPSLMLL
jgi:hypothetical protein